MTKFKTTRTIHGGGFGGVMFRVETKVQVLKKGEELPPDAEPVPDDTPEHDWKPVEEE